MTAEMCILGSRSRQEEEEEEGRGGDASAASNIISFLSIFTTKDGVESNSQQQ